MNREIKFRGIAISNGEMVYGSLIKKRNNVFAEWMIEDENGLGSDVVTDTIGQYTGLKDRNGVEIYEGDIYHLGDTNITYTIVWFDFSLVGKQIHSSCYVGFSYWREKIEVIGNIYNHPELLDNLSERP